jgi:amino acid transporter
MSDNGPNSGMSVESFGYRQELKRALSLPDLLICGLVLIMPIGPFSVFGFVFNASRGMVPLVYFIGVAAMMFTALSYMTMSRAFPIAGSVYAYAGRGIGESAGFVAGWAILLDYMLIPTLIYLGCAFAMSAIMPAIPKVIWVLVFVTVATTVNLLGITATARLNKLLLALQLLLLAAFAVLCAIGLTHGLAGSHLSLAPLWDSAKVTPSLVFGSLSLAALSFLGFDALSTLSEEVKGGPNMMGIATILSLGVVGALFVAQTYLASLFVLGLSGFPPGDASANAFLGIAKIVGGESFEWIVAVPGVVFAGIASALASQAATARLLYSMARDGKLPRTLAHIHPTRQTPQRATLLVAAVTLVLGVMLVDYLQQLVSLVNFGALFGFLMLHLSVVVHFMWKGRSRRWIIHLVVPGIGFAVMAYVLFSADELAKIAGCIWLAIGGVVLGVLKLRGRPLALPTDAL